MAGLLDLVTGLFSESEAQKSRNADLAFEKQRFATETALINRQNQIAEQLQREGVATRRDASGNTSYYDPKTNAWQTILSSGQKQIQDASDREQRLQLGPDAQAARNQRVVAADQRGQDLEQAGNARAGLTDVLSGRGAANSDQLASALAMSRRGAISSGLADYSNELGTQALRSGSAGLDRVGSALALARTRAVAEGMGNPVTEGQDAARTRNAADVAARGGVYNALATRAANIHDAAFAPVGIDTALRGQTGDQAGLGIQGGSQAATAYANAAQNLNRANKPDFVGDSTAKLWKGIGAVGDSFIDANSGGGGGGGGMGGTLGTILGFL